MRKLLFPLALGLMMTLGAQATKQVYTSYNASNNTLTYYYDEDYAKQNRPNSVKYDPTSTEARWTNYNEDVTTIAIDESMKDAPLTSMNRMFYGRSANSQLYKLSKATSITGLDNLPTKNVTDMHSMFFGLESLKSLNLSSFNTANVEDMSEMFENLHSLTSLDLSSFNTANVTSMSYMFDGLKSLKSLDLSSFNTAKVTNMQCMFVDCQSLTSLDLASFNTSNVTNMLSMFNGRTSLKSINLSSFNTEKVTTMAYMFKNCTALTTLDIAKFRFTELTTAKQMFNSCSNLTTIYCNAYLSERDMLTESTEMFTGCTKLKGGNNTAYNSSKTNKEYACPDKSNTPGYFTTKKCIYAEMSIDGTVMYIHYDTNLQYANLDWNADGRGAYLMTSAAKEKITEVNIHSSVANARPTTCREWFRGMKNLTKIENISNLNTSECTSMRAMFSGCNNLASLNVSGFNTAKVENMSAMFANCTKLTGLDVTKFNTANVLTMLTMFYGCKALTSLDLKKFNISKVWTMEQMFYNCSALQTIYCDGNWSASNTLTQSSNMFYGCTNLVGGKGTAYNSSYLDKTYARPDEGTAKKGYFNGIATGIEEVMEAQPATSGTQKVMIDGQIYILRDGKAYNLQGAEIIVP